MLKGTVRLFRVKGIPVTINWTWLFVFVLVFRSLAHSLFRPDDQTLASLSLGTRIIRRV